MKIIWVCVVGWFGLLPRAMAFPEMVRHGYTHCSSCHTSLVGGGLLTEYGRSLSKELLSQPKLSEKPVSEGDEKFASGFFEPGDKWLLGGQVRLLQLFKESKTASSGRFLIMQVDFDASYRFSSRVRGFASLGRIEPNKPDKTALDFVASPRHGIEILLSSPDAIDRWALRLGRFMPAYGIAFAEHTFVTRQSLGFVPGNERYGAELAWNNDQASVVATAILARTQGLQTESEQGGIVQAAFGLREDTKVGLNYYQSSVVGKGAAKGGGNGGGSGLSNGAAFDRQAYGVFAHLAFSKRLYGLLEVDRMRGEERTWGFMDTFKLGYEIQQGWHLLAVQEYKNKKMDSSDPRFESYAIGTEWFPRPHWDLLLLLREERDTSLSLDFGHVAWVVANFYL